MRAANMIVMVVFASACGAETTAPRVAAPVVEVGQEQPAPREPVAEPEPALEPPRANPAALRNPSLATGEAPARFRVEFDTTRGTFTADCHREWAPHGADRLYNLVRIGFFEDIALYRVVRDFVVQFGIHGTPEIAAAWADARLPADPVVGSNTRGALSFAMAGSPDTRSTQLFINYGDNARLDTIGFAPVCRVEERDMVAVVDQFHAGSGERPTREQSAITHEGNTMLRAKFPLLDYILRARLR